MPQGHLFFYDELLCHIDLSPTVPEASLLDPNARAPATAGVPVRGTALAYIRSDQQTLDGPE
ncbi:hypothetical protein ASG68_13275 [Rhizobium sp. Leaf453]|nr:hypothetical protein ASG42_17355 [Rhizobium sp. Leaf391]KQT03866.1 hypothetical protein ASG50_16715 [Rhizobium sp. Leaf386]KQT95672.1 hypothetical protein ASG68_13275 [Rhizobium sp. Leaf453]